MDKTKLTTLSAILMSSMLFAAGGAVAQGTQSTQGAQNAQDSHNAQGAQNAQQGAQGNRDSQQRRDTDGVDNTRATSGAHSTSAAYISSRPTNAIHADDLIGANVKSTQEDDGDIGSISNILLDRDGEAIGVVVGVGGFLGMGEKDVAVEWDSLDITQEDDGDYVVRIDATQEALEGAEGYVTD